MISEITVVSSNCVGAGLSNPLCQGVGGVGSAIFGTGASAALDALSTWVGTGSAWLADQTVDNQKGIDSRRAAVRQELALLSAAECDLPRQAEVQVRGQRRRA